jgi:hypothetical protein
MIILLQLLCPLGHCLCAMAYESSLPATEAERLLKRDMARYGWEERCGLCDSQALRFQHGPTPYHSLDAAEAALRFTHTATEARWN